MAFLSCVGFRDYGVMRKAGSSVVCPLSGRYVAPDKLDYLESENDKKVQRK